MSTKTIKTRNCHLYTTTTTILYFEKSDLPTGVLVVARERSNGNIVGVHEREVLAGHAEARREPVVVSGTWRRGRLV